MATASVTWSFTPLTTASSSQVNQNFADVVSFLNNSTVHRDGTGGRTMTIATSTTRPSTPFEGQIIYETDTDLIQVWNGSAWREVYRDGQAVNWTPSIFQGANVAFTNNYARYTKTGRWVEGAMHATITGAGGAGNTFDVSIPFTAAAPLGTAVGSFLYFDAGSTIYVGTAYLATTTSVRFYTHNNGAPLGQTPSFGAANTDVFSMQFSFEATT